VPIAAFQAITWRNGRLDAFGLGDCSLFLIDATGMVQRATGLPGSGGREAEEAAAARAAGGALAGRQLYERDDVMERLRADRARFNRKDGPVWTIGAEPEAANHIHHVALAIEPPVTGLLASDGFAALVDSYRHFDAAGLLAAARQDGLTVLGSLLRQLERVADPECAIWPRYKVSDDATAVLFTIGA